MLYLEIFEPVGATCLKMQVTHIAPLRAHQHVGKLEQRECHLRMSYAAY